MNTPKKYLIVLVLFAGVLAGVWLFFRPKYIPMPTALPTTESETPTPSLDPNLPTITDRLIIPTIDVNMPLFTGTSANILLKGGWVFPGTSTPPNMGNTVVFAHRFRYMPPISNTFYALDKLHIGDVFKITWHGRSYTYSVTESKIIQPTDFSVLARTDQAQITLITCAPLFSSKQRLVVIAQLIQ